MPKHVFAAMEKELHERDRVGLQDQVLLENYENDKNFIENLRKRFQENIIYVSSRKVFFFCQKLYHFIFLLSDIHWTSTHFCKSIQRAAHLYRRRGKKLSQQTFL